MASAKPRARRPKITNTSCPQLVSALKMLKSCGMTAKELVNIHAGRIEHKGIVIPIDVHDLSCQVIGSQLLNAIEDATEDVVFSYADRKLTVHSPGCEVSMNAADSYTWIDAPQQVISISSEEFASLVRVAKLLDDNGGDRVYIQGGMVCGFAKAFLYVSDRCVVMPTCSIEPEFVNRMASLKRVPTGVGIWGSRVAFFFDEIVATSGAFVEVVLEKPDIPEDLTSLFDADFFASLASMKKFCGDDILRLEDGKAIVKDEEMQLVKNYSFTFNVPNCQFSLSAFMTLKPYATQTEVTDDGKTLFFRSGSLSGAMLGIQEGSADD